MTSNIISSSLNIHATPFSVPHYSLPSLPSIDVKGAMIQRVIDWGFSSSIVKYVREIMNEWYSGTTINGILNIWEKKTIPLICQQIPLNILTYNVQGWGTRALESIDLIFKTDS